MRDGFEDLKGRLLDAVDGVRDRMHARSRGRQGRKPHLPAITPALDDARERWREAGFLVAARERIRPWFAVPAIVASLALIVGGFWLGGAVGDHAQAAAALTSTVKLKGKVITIDGNRFISTPAVTVKVKGKTVHIPAHTVRLPGSTVVSGQTVAVDVNRTVKVPVTISSTSTQTQTNTTTINNTVTTVTTVIQTVTGPTTTVQGPPITITVPGPTVTVTVTT